MARTADVFNEDTKGQPLGSMALPIAAASVAYEGSYLQVGRSFHGTAAIRGDLAPYNDEIGAVPVGLCHQGGTGVTAATVFGAFDPRGQLRKVAVTGATAQATDAMRWVYGSDDGTWTLTRPSALAMPLGVVWEYVSGTTCWVYFLSFGELLCLQASGAAGEDVLLGVVTEGAATGNMLTGIRLSGHGLITACYGIVTEDATDADVVQTINLEIGGVDVTGGVITWAFGDAIGTKLAGTAITAANRFHDGDLLDVETVATVAGTAAAVGKLSVYATIVREPGL